MSSLTQHEVRLLVCTLVAIAGLVVLVARFKIHAFIALLLASMFAGIASGTAPVQVAKAFQEGMGNTLGFIALVVGLGTMLGKMLAESGGAAVIAETFARRLGTRNLHWAMLIVGFVVGLPVFFGVGLVLLIPILVTLVRQTKVPLLFLGIPMIAGLSVSHGLVPPHPGPVAAIAQLGADTGKTIAWALLVSVPTAIIAGPVFARFIAPKLDVHFGALAEQVGAAPAPRTCPSFASALGTILLPVLLMLVATLADLLLPADNYVRVWADFIGSPAVAMLLAVLVSFFTFGRSCGYSAKEILKFTEECVGPAAGIILIVGAGGGFSKVLDVSGAGRAVVALFADLNISPLVLGWTFAALIRVAVGSATVAITMAAGLIAPVAVAAGTNLELLVVALGAGSLILSHLNDGGFWFVKEYFGMSVSQTFKSWTVMETIISVVALFTVLLLDWVRQF